MTQQGLLDYNGKKIDELPINWKMVVSRIIILMFLIIHTSNDVMASAHFSGLFYQSLFNGKEIVLLQKDELLTPDL